jgi:ATP-dependent helicase/nuclease subunit A
MSNPVVDLEQRRLALAPNGSFIVQAPAGSGKTGLITQRFLVLLARVEQPEEIVAITFTRKAAAEMRERLLEALMLATRPLPEHADDYLKQTWELARAALTRDGEQGWRLLQNPVRLRIQTIDSLCASLTRQLPVLSKFGAQPAISDDPGALYLEAARATLSDLEQGENWSPAIEQLLAHLDNNLSVAEQLLVSMLARRDQWLRHLVNVREPQWRETLEMALAHTIEDALAKINAVFPSVLVSDLMELVDFSSQRVSDDHLLAVCRGLTQLPSTNAETLPQWLGLCELLLTKEGGWRKSFTAGLGFPAPSGTKDKVEKTLFKQKKDDAQELIGALAEEAGLQQQLHDLRSLPAPHYSDAQWQIVEAMCELLLVAVAHLRVVFGSRGQVDFSEMSQSALAALGDEEAPSDLALALDYRIQHLLVDEFQDTSFGQYELLQRLTAGWQPDDGRTLFLVGDPMQSIYRFREAEVGLYLRARHEGIGAVALIPLTLSVNFRSQAGVVDWVNESFATVFPDSEDITVGAVAYANSVAFHGHDGEAVQVHPWLEQGTVGEADRVVELIRNAQRENPDGSIAVLVRARSHLAEIVAAMKRTGLRYRAIEIEQLGHRPVVQDLYVLARALLHPGDRLAWLALLRAPWCGLELADLTLLTQADPRAVIWQQLEDDELLSQLSASGQQRLARLRAVFEQAVAAQIHHGLRHWVESVWLQLGGPACVDNATDLEDAEVFLTLLKGLDSAGGLDDLQLLDERLARLFALPDIDADDRLQLMTIHKSKGLEFDTVILPGLGRKAPPDESALLMWLERWSSGAHGELLLAPLRATGEAHDAVYSYLKSVDKRKGEYETGRVLYVAATRARRRLHLLGHTTIKEEDLRPPQSSSLLKLLWPMLEPEFVRAQESYKASADEVETLADDFAVTAELKRLTLDWQPPKPSPSLELSGEVITAEQETALEFSWAGETARHVGTVVHELLQRIAQQGGQHWDAQRIASLRPYYGAALLRHGVMSGALDNAIAQVEQSLLQTLDDERGRWILDVGHQESACELALSGVLHDRVVRVVIDRTFVDENGTRWIIDYKTGSHEGSDADAFLDREQLRYQQQLECYAALLRLQDERPIRLGLYFPLLQGWRSWEV